jgi:LysM repeat protein
MSKIPQGKRLSRRQILGSSLALGLGGALAQAGLRPPAARAAPANHHLVWVWQFSTDGPPNVVGARLHNHGLGIVLKTHDGLQWMSEYDKSPYAVSGPPQITVLTNYFESAGVPFHCWCVVHGTDPVREANMAAQVLAAGARSIFLDVEPHAGFWRGTPQAAQLFGQELRRLQPDARIVLSIDPRPWTFERIPLREFAAFTDAMAPQLYWSTFNTQANYDRFVQIGVPVPPTGVTPEFLLDVSTRWLTAYGKPIVYVGQGAAADPAEWRRFMDAAYAFGSDFVTAWRYGVMSESVFSLLKEIPPRQPPAPQIVTYVVQAGDTVSAIAAAFGTTVDALVELNGLTDPNYLFVGQELRIAGGAVAVASTPVGQPAVTPASATAAGRTTYVVQPGDTLYAIAGRFGTTVEAIASLNSITDPNLIYADQTLQIP